MNILILEPENYSEEAISIYRTLGNVSTSHDSSNVDILVCRLKYHLNQKFLEKFPNLKFIVSPTTGLTHIDQSYTERQGIKVISLNGPEHRIFLSSISSTAELTFALLLSLIRNINQSSQDVLTKGNWDRDRWVGVELQGLTLGIYGYGRIGKIMAKVALGFSMSVIFYDTEEIATHGPEIRQVTRDELAEQSDIISLHVNFHQGNAGIIRKEFFMKTKKKPIFLNTSRGELVDENDLIWALENGLVSAAGLDVLQNENNHEALMKSPLIDYAKTHPNVLITPHIGGATKGAMKKTEDYMASHLANLPGFKR